MKLRHKKMARICLTLHAAWISSIGLRSDGTVYRGEATYVGPKWIKRWADKFRSVA